MRNIAGMYADTLKVLEGDQAVTQVEAEEREGGEKDMMYSSVCILMYNC